MSDTVDDSNMFFKTYEIFSSIQTEYPKVLDKIFLFQIMFGTQSEFQYSKCIKNKDNFRKVNQNLLNSLKDFREFLDSPDNY